MALLLTSRHLARFSLKHIRPFIVLPKSDHGAQTITPILFKNNIINRRWQSFDAKKPENLETETKPLSNKDKLKQAVSQYGATVFVFHVGISLMSLGVCYLLVSNGLDVNVIVQKLGIKESYGEIATNAGTFAVAYAVHKVFAPVRIAITLGATPFIVRYLRSAGIIKKRK